jgi:type II secretory pathway pseudopilin PulG
MLVVLALMALATGIVLPRMAGWFDSVQERSWRADLRAYLESLPVRAFLAGEPRTVDAAALVRAVPGAPHDLELVMPQALEYGAAGAASGGNIEFRRAGNRERWTIEPVSGRVSGDS